MVSLREKAVKRILLSIAHVFVLQGQLTAYRKRVETLRTERIFARKFAGNSRRANFRSKNRGELSVEANYRSKICVDQNNRH